MQQAILWRWPLLMVMLKSPWTDALPRSACVSDPACGPIPGQSIMYSEYDSIEPPWPGNTTGAILNTTSGPPAESDLLLQNLLSAEWIIFNFYRQGVEMFNESAFVAAGFPITTYNRTLEIRNNEAGHLRIFQNQISTSSVKPGPCEYQFPFTDAFSYLYLQTVIEVSSMAFLTGLELQAKSTLSKGALLAIASTETRHETWSLMDNWNASPFAGPNDTFFPYANQILDFTNEWILNGSCPVGNPVYPSPRQNLPQIRVNPTTTNLTAPGSHLTFVVSGGQEPLHFDEKREYFAVFFHGVLNISMPLNTTTLSTTIPATLKPKGIYAVVLATEMGAPFKENVVAGPLILFESPEQLGNVLTME